MPKDIPKREIHCLALPMPGLTIIFLVKFNVFVNGYTDEDDPMLCIKLDVDFRVPFPRPRQLL